MVYSLPTLPGVHLRPTILLHVTDPSDHRNWDTVRLKTENSSGQSARSGLSARFRQEEGRFSPGKTGRAKTGTGINWIEQVEVAHNHT